MPFTPIAKTAFACRKGGIFAVVKMVTIPL
jgi:hypothetical protein